MMNVAKFSKIDPQTAYEIEKALIIDSVKDLRCCANGKRNKNARKIGDLRRKLRK